MDAACIGMPCGQPLLQEGLQRQVEVEAVAAIRRSEQLGTRCLSVHRQRLLVVATQRSLVHTFCGSASTPRARGTLPWG